MLLLTVLVCGVLCGYTIQNVLTAVAVALMVKYFYTRARYPKTCVVVRVLLRFCICLPLGL